MPPTKMSKAKTAPSRYRPHPMLAMEQRFRRKVLDDTGKPWAHWVDAARRSKKKGKDLEGWLQEQGIGAMASQWISYETTHEAAGYEDPAALVDALYAGSAKALRPVHEAVVDACVALGDDVTVTSCKTMVPVYRKHVFAEMRPVDESVELRLALGDVPTKGRLKGAPTGMPGERMTHHVRLASTKDVDAEVRAWLEAAYANGAGKMTRKTEFEVPADFAKAVRASKKAAATWESMTPAMRRDMVQWVTSAKQEDTRARRQATALEKLSSGKKRVY